ncbi:MAG: cell wall hydrolase [Clostridium butyricum]|nr:cell wall hydrolase [Clostridium butyricum]
MNRKNKLIMFIVAFVMILSLVPIKSVQAMTTDFDIISTTEVTEVQAKKWAKSKGATDTFVNLAELYWKYSEKCGDVNPAIAYVQAAKETGYGKFGGVLDEEYHNPCGMKTSSGGGDYDKNAHQKFDSWADGVRAHMDHLALYAGAKGYPKRNTYDPRHFSTIKGRASTTNELGTKWAPSRTYGEEVGRLYMDLMDYAGIEYKSSSSNYDKSKNVEISSNEEPNPVPIEKKPEDLKVNSVLTEIKAETIKSDDKVSITSSIGWKFENGKWYYYKDDGIKSVGWIKPDANWYYLDDETGVMKTGWLKLKDNLYYLESSGAMAKGWKPIDGKWYFMNMNTGAVATGVQYDGNNFYYLQSSGVMNTTEGWKKINDSWYYMKSNGQVTVGWYKENDKWYYLQIDGRMVTGLNKIDGKVYSFNDSGAMEKGWKSIGSKWYYFNNSGDMATGWINDGNAYYYLYDNGAMAKGWIKLENGWYFLQNSGAMATGWVTSNGDTYYLDGSGKMLTNTTIEGYKIGSNGKRVFNTSSSTKSNSDTSSSTKSGKTIYVDAGHDYGKDYGAEIKIDGVTYSETVLNMEVADKLKTALENKGYNVVMTRNLGEKTSFSSLNESLAYRANKANNSNAVFFISIHHNSAGEQAKGIETLYSNRTQDSAFGGRYDSTRITKSKLLATLINNNIANKLNLVNRGSKDQNLYVCRNVNMPAVLIETGFITNREEAKRCADPVSQQKVADAIAEVVASNF